MLRGEEDCSRLRRKVFGGAARWADGARVHKIGKSVPLAMQPIRGRSEHSLECTLYNVEYTRYVMPHIYPTVSRRCNARNQVPTKYTLRCAKTPKPTKHLARSINPKTIKKLFHIHLQSICQPSPKRTQQRNIIPNRRRRQRPRTGRDPRRP